jgi:hypothetical protein
VRCPCGLDGELFLAVEDAVTGVLDDDGDEFAGVAGSELHGLLVDHDPAVCMDAAAGRDRPEISTQTPLITSRTRVARVQGSPLTVTDTAA